MVGGFAWVLWLALHLCGGLWGFVCVVLVDGCVRDACTRPFAPRPPIAPCTPTLTTRIHTHQTFFSLPDSVLEGPDPDAAIPPHTAAASTSADTPAAGQGPSLPEGEESFLGSQTL